MCCCEAALAVARFRAEVEARTDESPLGPKAGHDADQGAPTMEVLSLVSAGAAGLQVHPSWRRNWTSSWLWPRIFRD